MSYSAEELKNLKSLAQGLRRRRRDYEVTQEQLAKKARVSQSTVAQIESVRKIPSLRTLLKILKALDLNLTVGEDL